MVSEVIINITHIKSIGRLGHGDQENQYLPKIIIIQSLFKNIACGNQHTVAIDENGYLYIWGSESRNCSK